MHKQFLGIKWNPETPPFSFLWIREFDSNTSQDYLIPVEVGKKLNISIHKEKFCIGHKINETEYYFCNKTVPNTYIQCYQCQRMDFSRCFITCDPSRGQESCTNREAYEYCQRTPRSVYLALIGSEIKVGISFNPLKRWINQGADVAIEVWRAKNGLEARKIEILISSELDISQAVNIRNKIESIGKYNKKALLDLRKKKEKVALLLQDSDYEYVESPLLNKEVYLAKYYGNIPMLNLKPIFVDLSNNPYINGRVIGMKGSLLVTKVRNTYYVFNMKEVMGHIISMEKESQVKRQKSLFEFI